MAWRALPIEIGDGLLFDETGVAAEGRWKAGARVRFRRGRPQAIGGWQRRLPGTLSGVCRAAIAWSNRARDLQIAYGTHSHLQIERGGALYDVTPTGLAVGAIDAGSLGGFGEGLYGRGAYGVGELGGGLLRTWSLAPYGEQLLASPRGGTLYAWLGNTGVRASAVAGAPAVIEAMFVDPNRYAVALGATEQGTGNFHPMLVRWSDQDDYASWVASATNKAGEFPVTEGAKLVGGSPGSPSLIWTDTALYEMRLLDADLVWGFPLVGTGCGLIGPRAHARRDGLAWWMSPTGQFFEFTGGPPTPLPCPLLDEVFDNLNWAQAEKVHAAPNTAFDEIWWLYPDRRDGDGRECSRYVAFHLRERHWTAGPLDRTAWIDAGLFAQPIAVTPGGIVYDHETGASADGGPLGEWLISGALDTEDGDAFWRIDGMMPDVENLEGVLQVEILFRDTPQGPERAIGPFAITAAAQVLKFQAQGRHARIRFSSATTPSAWRLGDPRWDVRVTGMQR
jgi:hypothetical protein